MYERTLQDISEAIWEDTYIFFQFIMVASRPLRVEELAEVLAFDFGAGPIHRLTEDWRPNNLEETVLSTCSSLIVIVDICGSRVVEFSHFSVKEFLTSSRLPHEDTVFPVTMFAYRRHIPRSRKRALVLSSPG